MWYAAFRILHSAFVVVLGVVVVVLLAGCGAAPPAGLSGDVTTGTSTSELAAVRAALDAGDYERALELLPPPTDSEGETARLLAQTRQGLAHTQIAAAPGDTATLRAGLDQVELALAIGSGSPPLRAELLADRQLIVALIEVEQARQALAQLVEGETPLDERIQAAQLLADRAQAAVPRVNDLPGANLIVGAALLDAAGTYETLGNAASGPDTESGWPEARALCEQAAALGAPEAVSCLARLDEKPAPAVVAAVPPPAPTAPPVVQRPAPTSRPAEVRYALAKRNSFEGSGTSGQFSSCIDVQILGRGGPVGGAVIGINNGEHTFQNQTDANGYTGRCGLGASTWSVVLFWTPTGGQIKGAATTVYVNGAPEQRAGVVFQER